MKGTWLGPDGYVPGLGMVTEGGPLSIADPAWAASLQREGKFKPDNESEIPPRVPKPRKSGGE
jgi:hypothetical protein